MYRDNLPPTPILDPGLAAQRAERTVYYRGMLDEMMEMGMDMARSLHAESKAEVPVDTTVAFERVCRCVRRTILLSQSLDAPARDDGRVREQARRRIIRRVEDTIESTYDGENAERMHAELLERLERPEFDEDVATRPVAEVAREICHDLGIEEIAGFHPWKRRRPADLALLHARAKGVAGAVAGEPLTLEALAHSLVAMGRTRGAPSG